MFTITAVSGTTEVVIEKLSDMSTTALAKGAYEEMFSDEAFEENSHTVLFDRNTGEHVALPLDGELKLVVHEDGKEIKNIEHLVYGDSAAPALLEPFEKVPDFEQAAPKP